MKPNLQFVETLEARVAPAILVNGGNLLGGTGNPNSGETSSGGNTVTLVKVVSGQALVFWDSGNSRITGISVGKHTVLDITGNIYGDIVTNLDNDGRLTDSDHNPANGEDGGILLATNIKGITTHALGNSQLGDIGRIISGGTVKNIDMADNSTLNGIYAGDGIFRDGSSVQVTTKGVDFNTINPGLDNVFGGAGGIQLANSPVASGASIKNIQVYAADQLQVFAGNGAANNGGVGGAGGGITNLTIVKTLGGAGDTPAAFLHTGDGGAGAAGGAGGNITNFNDQGSIAYVKLQTGAGGAGSGGSGGDGGTLTASTIVTSSPRYDLIMGAGGEGVSGGRGGAISQLNFTNNVTGGQSLITSGDFNNDGHRDVLLVNTLNGNATLSLGTGGPGTDTEAAFTVAYQTTQTPGGTALTPFIAPLGSVPTDVAVADLNGDGHLDFVVSYAGSNNLGVFLGSGTGTFTGHSIALNLTPTHLAAGNFTGTAATDLAVLSGGNTPSANGGLTSAVAILKNDGAGNFAQPAAPLALVGTATDFAPAQINAAGGTDLFVGFTNGTVDTLFANGTTFTAGPVITAFTSTGTTNVPVDSLDATNVGTDTLLLAFSKNIAAGVMTTNPDGTTTAATATPSVKLFTISASGAQGGFLAITPSVGATTAHFVMNSTAVGIVSPGSLDLYQSGSSGYTQTASLGSDGMLNDFSAYNNDGTFQIAAVGASTSRFFYTEGSPGSQSGVAAFKPFDIPFTPGVIRFVAGDGGAGTTLNGGAGGAISSLTFKQQLGGGVLQAGGAYNVIVTTGSGGDGTAGGAGGRGGDLSSTDLTLNPAYLTVQDDTSAAVLTTGHGGSGATGGNGGNLSGLTSTSVFSQQVGDGLILGSVAVQITAGDGGAGTAGAGGAGGSVTLAGKTSISGVTFFDADSATPFAPALSVHGGNGGAGTSAGGAGGGLFNIGTQNAPGSSVNVAYNELSSASVLAGSGGAASAGNGGAGGSVNSMDVAVQRTLALLSKGRYVVYGGSLEVAAGDGGAGVGGIGGKGGSISKSTAASVDGDDTTRFFGVLATAGAGGDGDLGGGAGGNLKKLTLNSPSADDVYAAVLTAGNGGAATTSGAGGDGGKVKGVTQTKDVNSSINVIQAGNGGASASGAGGGGGSVKAVDTVGFIGLPAGESAHLGVFDPEVVSPAAAALFAGGVVPQGIFAGQGADGAANGSVLNIVARQVAAIGASVNANGTFGVAAAVSGVTADLIGYDVNGNGAYDANGGSPSANRPTDGFILAGSVAGISTLDNNRTAAFTFNS